MDEQRFLRMKAGLERNGVTVWTNDASQEDLDELGAYASTSPDGRNINLGTRMPPSASAFFEEIIHVTQIKNLPEELRTLSYLASHLTAFEIKAKEKVLRNSKAYGLTDSEIEELKESLRRYRSGK